MNDEEMKFLLEQYLAGKCSESERDLVERWYQAHEPGHSAKIPNAEIEQDLRDIGKHLPLHKTRNRINWGLYAAAATIVAALFGAYFMVIHRDGLFEIPYAVVETVGDNDIMPGSNKATLTLADGRSIFLDDVSNGTIATQESNIIFKNESGQLIYKAGNLSDEQLADIPFNTVTTPRGGQYQVTLPDGTKVWINAESSLTYAAVDDRKERIVRLNGEAYFEVIKSKGRPFRVVTARQTIEVLGTQFNINSYSDEPAVKTTLIEGSVNIREHATKQNVILTPGQQASLDAKNQLSVKQVNVNDAVAWKSGLFRFENSDIETIMRQFARWYDVEVAFEGEKPNIKLWGEAYRNSSASEVLDILTYFDLKYRIESIGNGKKKITIYT